MLQEGPKANSLYDGDSTLAGIPGFLENGRLPRAGT